MMVNGKWDADWHPVQAKDEDGRFIRQTSSFRDWVTPDGRPGPEGQPGHKAEAGRYHLYLAYICPWACRTLMARHLKGLEDVISISLVNPVLTDQGWSFGGFPGSTEDPHLGAHYMHEIYAHADNMFTGRATVPVLWDKVRRTIVNNESADILRILDKGFGDLATDNVRLRPDGMDADIDQVADMLYDKLNNGVYRAGFASSQKAYEEAVDDVFGALDAMETRLADGRAFLMGDQLTEADLRLFVTLVRFDAAYVGLFKCNRRRIADYPGLSAYIRRVIAIDGMAETVRVDHIKAGYYSIKALNPSGIVPEGPVLEHLELAA